MNATGHDDGKPPIGEKQRLFEVDARKRPVALDVRVEHAADAGTCEFAGDVLEIAFEGLGPSAKLNTAAADVQGHRDAFSASIEDLR